MKKVTYIFSVFGLVMGAGIVAFILLRGVTPEGNSAPANSYSPSVNLEDSDMISLPEPRQEGHMSLEEALALRRSIRSYANVPLSLNEVSQLLWSAQGITNEQGFRTAPSAGATFPLEMYMMVNNVEGLERGIYHYNPVNNTLKLKHQKDVSAELTRASLSQSMVSDAGVVLIFGAVFERTESRYGERGERYVYNEIGHAGQNVHLQAAALDLGTVVIGAYRDDEVEQILQLSPEVRVLYMMPVGKMNP